MPDWLVSVGVGEGRAVFNTLLAGREVAEKELRMTVEAVKASMRIALADARQVCRCVRARWRACAYALSRTHAYGCVCLCKIATEQLALCSLLFSPLLRAILRIPSSNKS